MKKILCLAVSLLALNLTPVFGQPAGVPRPKVVGNVDPYAEMSAEKPVLTKFNLDFPGGTPKELVTAIEKATGKPLNVIIPNENTDTKLPPLKLSDITFPQLADTMKINGSKNQRVWNPTFNSYTEFQTAYFFATTDNQPTDNSVWLFYITKMPEQSPIKKVCQFYSLAPYLDRGFTVDDITTAIQTGWKMSGETSLPELNYHKETKLLIAYGPADKLQTIADVLKTLPTASPGYWDRMNNAIGGMQEQIMELQRKISMLTTNTPAEKSGK